MSISAEVRAVSEKCLRTALSVVVSRSPASAPLVPLLDRLFAKAEAAAPETNPAVAALSDAERVSLVQSRLRPGAFLVADDADSSPKYPARVRSPAEGYMSTPFAEDVELSMRIA